MDVVLTRRIVALRKQDLDFLKELTRSEIARHQGVRTRTVPPDTLRPNEQ